MKKTLFLTLVLALFLCSCSTNKVSGINPDTLTSTSVGSPASQDSLEIVKAPDLPSLGGKRAMIKAVIYKTNGDWNNYVTANFDTQTDSFISYPAPTDVNADNAPIPLIDGWLLDRRGGTGLNTVFLNWTYSEYHKLSEAPSIEQLRNAIIPNARVTEVITLPMSTFDAQRDPEKVKRYILENIKNS